MQSPEGWVDAMVDAGNWSRAIRQIFPNRISLPVRGEARYWLRGAALGTGEKKSAPIEVRRERK